MTKTGKRLLIVLLGTVMVVCAGLAAIGGKVYADESIILESFKIYEGASVRVVSPVGIRFETGISTEDKEKLPENAVFGTLIIPSDMLSGELTLETADVLNVETKVWKETPSSFGDGYEGYNSVLVGQNFGEFDEEFYNCFLTARGYVKFNDGSGEKVIYTGNSVERTMAGVADKALASGEDGEILSDIVEKAKAEQTLTLNFDTMGGSTVSPLTTVVGALISAPEAPVNGDKVFCGWYTGEDFSEEFTFGLLKESITVYARFADESDILIDIPEVTAAKQEFTLPVAEVNGTSAGGTQKVFIAETVGGNTPVSGPAVTFDAEGDYTLIFEVSCNGTKIGSVTKTVYAYEEEAGNVSYFDKGLAESVARKALTGWDEDLISSSKETVFPGEKFSLRYDAVSESAAYFKTGKIVLNNPVIKDISAYNYITMYIYTDLAGVTVGFNELWANGGTPLIQSAWTRLVLYKDASDNWYMPNGVLLFGAGSSAAGPQDITNFILNLDFTNTDYTSGTFYVSGIRVSNAVDSVDIAMPITVSAGTPFTVPNATVNDSTEGVTQKVYDITSEKTEITEPTVTLENEGVYSYLFEVYKDGKYLDSVVKTVSCLEPEPGNVTHYNKEFGISSSTVGSFGGTISTQSDITLPGEDYSLKYDTANAGGAMYFGVGSVMINNPFIKDISPYTYMYMYIYTENEGVGVRFNNIPGATPLTAGEWNLIVISCESGSWLTPSGSYLYGDASAMKDATDITNFTIDFEFAPNTNITTYISAVRVSITAPVIE